MIRLGASRGGCVTHILLVEDQPMEARAYARVLREEAEVVHAPTLAAASREISARSFDGAVLDLHLADGLGLDLVPGLRARNPDASIMLFSGDSDPEILGRAAELGALFALKASAAVLRTFARGCVRRPVQSHTRLRSAVDVRAMLEPASLTKRELEVVAYAVLGLSRADVAARMDLAEGTCAYHISNVLKKTGHARISELIAWLHEERERSGT